MSAPSTAELAALGAKTFERVKNVCDPLGVAPWEVEVAGMTLTIEQMERCEKVAFDTGATTAAVNFRIAKNVLIAALQELLTKAKADGGVK